MFLLRLAKSLADAGHKVSLFILLAHRVDRELCRRIAPGVPIHSPRVPGFEFWSKVDTLLFKLRLDFSFLRIFYTRALINYILAENVQVLHTHLFTTDIVGATAARATGIRAVTTIHGDYLMYNASERLLAASRVLNFRKKLLQILKAYDAIIVISEEQLDFFRMEMDQLETKVSLLKIYNGFFLLDQDITIARGTLGIPENALVFGMVARGIREKGWQELIDAFRSANLPGSYLVLVGDGDFLAADPHPDERPEDFICWRCRQRTGLYPFV